KNVLAGYQACFMFQVRPNPYFGACDPSRGQTGHTGGMNVCLGDGSVRFVGQGITQATWSNACDPRDGNVLGNDWRTSRVAARARVATLGREQIMRVNRLMAPGRAGRLLVGAVLV